MSVAIVVVTTTTHNRDEICTDLNKRYFNFLDERSRPKCLTISRPIGSLGKKDYEDDLKACIKESGAIVVNLSATAIRKVRLKLGQVWRERMNAYLENQPWRSIPYLPFPEWALIKVFFFSLSSHQFYLSVIVCFEIS